MFGKRFIFFLVLSVTRSELSLGQITQTSADDLIINQLQESLVKLVEIHEKHALASYSIV